MSVLVSPRCTDHPGSIVTDDSSVPGAEFATSRIQPGYDRRYAVQRGKEPFVNQSSRRNRILIGVVAALAALALVVGLAPGLWVSRLRPVARERVIELLEKRFDDVRLEKLDIRLVPGLALFPRLVAVGGGLSVSLPGRAAEGVPPFITMTEFEVEVGLLGILREPVRVKSLRLDQLTIQIPPKRDDSPPRSEREPPPVFLIEDLVADGAILRIIPRNPEKEPLQFDLHQLRVQAAGLSEPMRFDAILQNAKPPGEIQTKGEFGPLVLFDAGATRLSGEYVFADADLSVFKGIGGKLYSEGRFAGVLARIEVKGFTQTPDFQLTSAGNPVDLRTDFEAIVDGTNGDTLLSPVNATLAGSNFRTAGGVTHRVGTPGKTVCLAAEGADGRIEDFLRLAMKSERPFMTGAIRFRSLILIPPGNVDVVEKLVLDGEFVIDSALFPESKVQGKVDDLSQIARSEKSDEGSLTALQAERVLSDMRGSFRLEKGVMSVSYVSFRVPGAEVRLEGTYGLVTRRIDFRGELRMEAKVSEMTTGWKSFFLKIVDPLFRTKDSGSVIPIKIQGTPDAPLFGVEVGRVFSREQVTSESQGPSEHGPWKKTLPSCTDILGNGGIPVDPGPATTSSLPFVHERAGLQAPSNHTNDGASSPRLD